MDQLDTNYFKELLYFGIKDVTAGIQFTSLDTNSAIPSLSNFRGFFIGLYFGPTDNDVKWLIGHSKYSTMQNPPPTGLKYFIYKRIKIPSNTYKLQIDDYPNLEDERTTQDFRIYSVEIIDWNDNTDIMKGTSDPEMFIGYNILSYQDSTAGIQLSLDQKLGKLGDAKDDIIINIPNVRGSNFPDTIIGDYNNNIIEGGGGGDILNGGAGTDMISYKNSPLGVRVDLNSERQRDLAPLTGSDSDDDMLSNFENIQGSDNDDSLKGNN